MNLTYREAREEDLPKLVELLADDELGQSREDTSTPFNKSYLSAFAHIDTDPNNELIIVKVNHNVVGMLQLTFIPYLTHIGSWRCLIEGVRVDKRYRGRGVGEKLFIWAIERAKSKNCNIVQLTSNKSRVDAIRFYENLGFRATHEGFKLEI